MPTVLTNFWQYKPPEMFFRRSQQQSTWEEKTIRKPVGAVCVALTNQRQSQSVSNFGGQHFR